MIDDCVTRGSRIRSGFEWPAETGSIIPYVGVAYTRIFRFWQKCAAFESVFRFPVDKSCGRGRPVRSERERRGNVDRIRLRQTRWQWRSKFMCRKNGVRLVFGVPKSVSFPHKASMEIYYIMLRFYLSTRNIFLKVL